MFQLKVVMKKTAEEILKLLRCKKAYSYLNLQLRYRSKISIAHIKELNKDCVNILLPYILYFPRNKPSKSIISAKKNLQFLIFHLKINFYWLKIIFWILNRVYSDRYELHLSDVTIRIKKFHFTRKLWRKNCWKLP